MSASPGTITALELGRRLRVLRAATGDPSLEELQGTLGISMSSLSGYEKGKTWPPIPKLLRLADHYGLTVGELLSDDWATRASSNGKARDLAA
jgi:transcriptional regulator with XRE-family HTH domain